MVDPQVSIVISSHNHGQYLAECIDSALHQHDARAEVIVVDDGSTDDSRAIIRSYGNTVKSLFQRNDGQASAWNAGARQARGTWVVFLDCDDRLTGAAVGAIIAAGEQMPSASKIHWRMRLIGPQGEYLGIDIPEAPLPVGDRLPELISFGFDRGPNVASSGNAWNSTFLREVMPIPELPFRISADTVLLGLSPLFGSTVALESVYSEYRCHPGNNGAAGSTAQRSADITIRATLVFGLVAAALTKRGINVDPKAWEMVNPTFIRHRRLAES